MFRLLLELLLPEFHHYRAIYTFQLCNSNFNLKTSGTVLMVQLFTIIDITRIQ
jgi:hypothetical protein